MLRSAISKTKMMAATRRSLVPSSASKASVSTFSFNSSSLDDYRSSGNDYYTSMADRGHLFTKSIQTSVCNLAFNLSGNPALVSLDKTQSQLEEIDWGEAALSESELFALEEQQSESPMSLSLWLISTLKRRKKMMNKHKLRKRRKKLRLKTRK